MSSEGELEQASTGPWNVAFEPGIKPNEATDYANFIPQISQYITEDWYQHALVERNRACYQAVNLGKFLLISVLEYETDTLWFKFATPLENQGGQATLKIYHPYSNSFIVMDLAAYLYGQDYGVQWGYSDIPVIVAQTHHGAARELSKIYTAKLNQEILVQPLKKP